MRLSFLITILLISNFAFSNDKIEYKKLNWEKDPVVHSLLPGEEKELSIIQKDKRLSEYVYENGTLIQYYTIHRIIYVNSDAAIANNNTLYISTGNEQEVINPRARVILKNGKVKNFDKNSIRTMEEDGASYKFFAIDGAEVGCEIEYIYTIKSMPNLNGTMEIFQNEIPRKNVAFNIYLPKNLYINTKSYNYFPEMNYDSTDTERNIYFVNVDNVEALKSEKYAMYKSKLKSVIYKLDYNSATRVNNITSYSSVANNFYQRVHSDISKSSAKEISNIIQSLKLTKLEEEDKIRKIEFYLKNRFHIVEGGDEKYISLDWILKNNICNNLGIVKLFAVFLEQAGIEQEMGFTSNRINLTFDPQFEAYNFLQEYFFYFPQYEKYLAPTEFNYRYGYIPATWTNNYGLFIKKVSLGDMVTGVGKVKNIAPLSYELNGDTMDVEVAFAKDFANSNLKMKRSYTGYSSAFLQPVYDQLEANNKKEVTESVIKWINDNMDIDEVKVINTDEESIFTKPLILKGTAKTATLIEKAGEKYIFKVGEIIGQQQELYDESERQLDIDVGFNHYYVRKIKINIPEGYHVSNPEVLKINISDGEKNSMAFVSNYILNGNTLDITVEEYYKEINYSISEYSVFKEVINAAADFNKLVLFLEKN